MKLYNIFERAIDFGSFSSRENFFSFALKCTFYLVPALLLGNYTDRIIEKKRKDKVLGDNILYYIILQTLIIISTLYLIIIFLTSYTNEFQSTIAGGFFSVLYFGMQANYISMIKEYINY